ncbi:MAG TPA: PilN domain-containing protein [Candidatus Bathyarchaeia archaeon]|nr:PilN domain-containing protein [Candidatus Bathyarchaeia archaeon]
MLTKEKDFVAVSIGEHVLTIAHLKGDLSHQRLVAVARDDIDNGNPESWSVKIGEHLKGFQCKKPKAFCVIPSHIVTTKNIEIPSLDQEEIRSIIDLQAGRHTPYSREEILIGYVSIGVFQRNYTKVLLIIANREVINSRLEACETAGLYIEKIAFAPECIAAFYGKALNVAPENPPIGLIDITYSSTDFIVEHNRTVATCRNIPIGFSQLTQETDAKERLVGELVKTLEVYRNEDINEMPGRYVMTTEHSIAQELVPLLGEKFKIAVEVVSYKQLIMIAENNPVFLQALEQDSFINLISVVALPSTQFQVDLLPEEIKNQRSIEDKGKQVILSGIFAMVFLLFVIAIFFSKIYFLDTYLKRLAKEYVVRQYAVVQLDRVAHRTRIIKDYLSGRMVSLDVMEELYRLIPEQIYLQNIFLDEQGTINIQGISESMSMVFDVVKALEDSKLFKAVKTRSTTAKKDRGKDAAAFDIVFKLESAPDTPVEEAAPAEEAAAPAPAPAE